VRAVPAATAYAGRHDPRLGDGAAAPDTASATDADAGTPAGDPVDDAAEVQGR
jgi:hypothetical protein